MDDLVIAAIRRRLKANLDDALGAQLIPSNPVDVANDEGRLGLAFPPLMKRIYTEIGNGGFGPGYGLIGLTNGVPVDTGKTAPEMYEDFRTTNTDEPSWSWPNGLLPICHWGCAILSCVDCTDAYFRVRIFDPNVHDGEDWTDCFFEESSSFDVWIRDWASGVDLWKLMYGENGHITQILSARRSIR